MKPLSLLILLTALGGSEHAVLAATSSNSHPALLEQARQFLAEGEIYQAKRNVRRVLDEAPDNETAWLLMAEIIDYEIARQIETETTKLVGEYTDQERADAIKTWLERSQALLEIQEYDQAMLAAEKVFIFDPENIKASQLIDQIRKKAIEQGKGENLAIRRIYQAEIDARVYTYLDQAEEWINSGRWGAARLAIEKVLLLDPENRKALKLYKKVQGSHNQIS